MARWDRRTRLTAMLGLRDETKRGLASASRGFQTYLSGNSRAAGMAGMAVSGALSGHAAFAAAGMGTAFLTMTGSAVGAFIEVEKKWAEVTTLMPRMNDEALGAMKVQIDRFAKESGSTLLDAYDAAYQAVSAGIDPASTSSFLQTAHRAALAGVADITTAVDGLTSVINAYGLEVSDATRVSDAMFTAIRLGKTTFREMAPVLGPVLPIAASLNTEFEEITAALASLTAQGNPTAIALTQIRSALVALSKDTKAKALFEGLVGMTYQQFQDEGGTLQEALSMIVAEADRTGQSLAQLFGRIEGANAALALSSQKGAEVYTQAMSDMMGATDAAYNRMAETTDFQVRKWKAEWEDYKTWFGQDFVEMMSAAYGNFNDLLATFGVGMTMKEKQILETSEKNWRIWATNVAKTQAAHAEWARETLAYTPTLPSSRPWETGGGGRNIGPTQVGPGNVAQWIGQVSQMGGHGADAWGYADMLSRFDAIMLENIRQGYSVAGGAGGGGGGRATAAIEDLGMTIRELTALMRSGQALTVQLDANIDEGVILRADTVRRETGQVAARLGNLMVDRVRS